ncbi:hypothetical protein BU15DRAFT_86728 [Melanogaster broomeanus]|nr:hypothetical protein BU15DRAFT_86728 [Melanogaster broomeanus]
MVYRKISTDMKQRALELLEMGWEMDEVTDALGMSSRSVNRWADNYEEHGRVDPPSVLRGRPRLLNAAILTDLHGLVHETPSLLRLKVLIHTAAQRDEVARERAVESVMHKRGERWSIIPALTTGGYIALRAIPGSVNGEDCFEFILNDEWIPILPKMAQFPQRNSVLVMDNASIHKK